MNEFLNNTIVEIGSNTIKLNNIAQLLLFFTIILVVFILAKKGIYRIKTLDEARKFSISKLIQYFLYVFSIVISLQILGFDITVLLAGSAALLVGIGLGMQRIFSDFVSGIILLMDRSLKIGDIIEVNDTICKVQKINFRTTTVIGRDENYIIVPNSELTQNKVTNWTYNSIASRFKITVGVDYSTDVLQVMEILKESANKHALVLKSPEPFVRFEDYGDSSLLFSVYFWSNEVFRVENVKSNIRIEIFKIFKENGINIPFPQRVVHLKK